MEEYKPIKIRIDKIVERSRQSYEMYTPKLRPKLYPYVFKPIWAGTMEIETLATDKAIGDWMCEHFEPGRFNLFRFIKAKTKTHAKPYHLCRIIIHDNENNRYTIEHINGRLARSYIRKNKNKKSDTNG